MPWGNVAAQGRRGKQRRIPVLLLRKLQNNLPVANVHLYLFQHDAYLELDSSTETGERRGGNNNTLSGVTTRSQEENGMKIEGEGAEVQLAPSTKY